MIEIRAEVCGWFKRMKVPNGTMDRGYVDIGLAPLLHILTPAEQRQEQIPNAAKVVRLYYQGTTEDGRPWFRHE